MSAAVEQIRAEINKHGAISFARFMELSLYCPLCGYYEKKEDTPGRRGDFYTSVSVGPLFGNLLAFQFAEWIEQSKVADAAKGDWAIVEAGAHDGQLARDILAWLQRQRPAVFELLEYRIVEPSSIRQQWQRETLAAWAGRVRWFPTSHSALRTPHFTVFFSNELLDAFPVHRLGWDAKSKSWFEWGVTLERDQPVWTRLTGHFSISNSQFPILNSAPGLLAVLPDDFSTEISPAAEAWWRETAANLGHGKLLTLDYGLSAAEFLAPTRAHGTLRAYRHHRLADDLLAAPGEQDLTAHVNFTAIQSAGEAAGLRTEAFVSQAQFLTAVAAKAWEAGSGFGEWTPERTRQFQTLTHPDLLGRAFRVLVQSCEERNS